MSDSDRLVLCFFFERGKKKKMYVLPYCVIIIVAGQAKRRRLVTHSASYESYTLHSLFPAPLKLRELFGFLRGRGEVAVTSQ